MLKRTINKLWKSTVYSLAGLQAAWHRELAIRIEIIGIACLLPMPFLISGLSNTQQAIMLITLIMPMVIELLNSAIEALCNIVSKEYHTEIKFIKDASSAAVFIASIIMALTWGLCLWPLFFSY